MSILTVHVSRIKSNFFYDFEFNIRIKKSLDSPLSNNK